jgi:hypothetical protein
MWLEPTQPYHTNKIAPQFLTYLRLIKYKGAYKPTSGIADGLARAADGRRFAKRAISAICGLMVLAQCRGLVLYETVRALRLPRASSTICRMES